MLQKYVVFWSKKFLNFKHGFRSAILAIIQLWQNGTFEPILKIIFIWVPMNN